jgi:hypothetical protein
MATVTPLMPGVGDICSTAFGVFPAACPDITAPFEGIGNFATPAERRKNGPTSADHPFDERDCLFLAFVV